MQKNEFNSALSQVGSIVDLKELLPDEIANELSQDKIDKIFGLLAYGCSKLAKTLSESKDENKNIDDKMIISVPAPSKGLMLVFIVSRQKFIESLSGGNTLAKSIKDSQVYAKDFVDLLRGFTKGEFPEI